MNGSINVRCTVENLVYIKHSISVVVITNRVNFDCIRSRFESSLERFTFFSALVLVKKITLVSPSHSSTEIRSLWIEDVTLASDADFTHSSLQGFSPGHANEEHLTNGPTRLLNSIWSITQSVNWFKFARILASWALGWHFCLKPDTLPESFFSLNKMKRGI